MLSRVIRYTARWSSAGAPVDHRHQVASRQRMNLGERFPQNRRDGVDVDAGGAEQRRHQVDVRCRCVDHPRLGSARADPRDGERDAFALVVEVEPLWCRPPCAQQFAVVGGADQHRIRRARKDCAAHPVDRAVDFGVQPVVEVAVALGVAVIDLLIAAAGSAAGVVGPEGDLRGGFAQILGGGRRQDVRRIPWEGFTGLRNTQVGNSTMSCG